MENWQKLEINQIGKVVSGGTPDTNNSDFWDGDVDWCTPTDITALKTRFLGRTKRKLTEKGLEKSSATILPIGSIIVCTRATIGECAINTVEMTTNQGFKNIIPKGNFNSDFIYYSIVLNKPELIRLSAGSTFGEVPKTAFEKLKLDVPPLGEQKKIAEILSTWDKSIETTEKLIAAKQKLKKSLMQRLLTGAQRFPEFHGQEWKVRHFEEFLTESRISGSHGALAKKITVKLYGKGVFEKRERNQGSENTKYYKRKTSQFIYSKLDFLNGAFGLIPEKLNDFESTLDLPTFDISEKLNSSYLLYYVSREEFYLRFTGSAEGGRKARRVQPDEFLQIKLKLPSLEEQKKIAAVLNIFDGEINVLQNKLAALRQQKRGLMQKLLTGLVRVKVDEN